MLLGMSANNIFFAAKRRFTVNNFFKVRTAQNIMHSPNAVYAFGVPVGGDMRH